MKYSFLLATTFILLTCMTYPAHSQHRDTSAKAGREAVHAQQTTAQAAVQATVRTVETPLTALALRLSPGMDIKEELERIVRERGIKAASVLTCVGSLREAVVRFANKPNGIGLKGPLEIVSFTGTLGEDGSHLHIALSSGDGTTVGGHVLAGCRVFTTAEIVLGILPGAVFTREMDSTSGYKELVVKELVFKPKR